MLLSCVVSENPSSYANVDKYPNLINIHCHKKQIQPSYTFLHLMSMTLSGFTSY